MICVQDLRNHFRYEDGNLVRKDSKRVQKPAGSHKGEYRVTLFNGKTYKTHRLIFLYHHGYLPEQIDHIDGDKHNNRIDNLRPCSASENSMNISIRSDSKSKAKGVVWEPDRQSWRVRVCVNSKTVYSARFKELESAKTAAINARNRYHGEYANHGV